MGWLYWRRCSMPASTSTPRSTYKRSHHMPTHRPPVSHHQLYLHLSSVPLCVFYYRVALSSAALLRSGHGAGSAAAQAAGPTRPPYSPCPSRSSPPPSPPTPPILLHPSSSPRASQERQKEGGPCEGRLLPLFICVRSADRERRLSRPLRLSSGAVLDG